MPSRWTNAFSLPSILTLMPHFLNEHFTFSRLEQMWSHAFPTYLVKSTLCSDASIFPPVYKWDCHRGVSQTESWPHLWKGLVTDTSNGWTRLVQPGGTFISSVFFLWRSSFTSSVCWARWISATKILPDELAFGVFVNIFPHSRSTQTFMTFSSHHALGWNITFTQAAIPTSLFIRWNPLPLSMKEDCRPHPRDSISEDAELYCKLAFI